MSRNRSKTKQYLRTILQTPVDTEGTLPNLPYLEGAAIIHRIRVELSRVKRIISAQPNITIQKFTLSMAAKSFHNATPPCDVITFIRITETSTLLSPEMRELQSLLASSIPEVNND